MKQINRTLATIGYFALAGMTAVMPQRADAQQAAIAIDNDDIGGVVRGPSGPEAGVWVIAETTELPTKFAKIVVTDDQGRYVIPDLPPNVNYQATDWWIRRKCARSQASSSTSRPCRRRTKRRLRTIIRRSTGSR
jgi:hypothetical protein